MVICVSSDPSRATTPPAGELRLSIQGGCAIALAERVSVAITRSHLLIASSASLLRESRAAVRRGKTLRRTGRDVRGLHSGFASGIITTRDRKRLAASTESVDGPQASDDSDACWANRTVFASRTIIGNDPRGIGTIDDPPSKTWHVREIDARDIPGAKAERCLVFENHELVRRLWNFPKDWATLPAAEVLALAGIG